MLRYFVVTCIVLQLTPNLAQRNGCSISVPKEDDRNQPIILTTRNSKHDIIIPERGAISLRAGESVDLFCPPIKNKLQQSRNNLTAATCVSGETLNIFNEQYQFNSLACNIPAKGSVVVTNSVCGNNQGHKSNIGFKVQSDWITLIQVCYDSNEGNALYAEHTLYGQAIKAASVQSYRPSFQNDGVVKGLSANNAYKQTSQKNVFAKLLGSDQLATEYIHKKSFLARGHLAPDADFLYPGFQFTTYYYINTCPQWDAVNGGNWLGIEHMVRKAADRFQKPLRIITGSHGVLTLPDINNNLQQIYLDVSRKLPVPKFLWKIVYDGSAKEGIAFVALNDPFIKRLTAEDLLCPDVCSTYGWDSVRWSNMKKGFVYCCDVKVLQQTVPTIPKLSIRGILRA